MLTLGGNREASNHKIESTAKKKGMHSKKEIRENEVEKNKKLGNQL